MATRRLNDHIALHIDKFTTTVDISRCVIGQNTRSVRRATIVQLKNSITELGYDQVHTVGSRHLTLQVVITILLPSEFYDQCPPYGIWWL